MSAHLLSEVELQTISQKAIEAKSKAYCQRINPSINIRLLSPLTRRPGRYSNFHVGACILTSTGEYISGANIENAAYPVGVCAERVAFGTAIMQGHRSFKAIAVATDIKPAASPCGMCRQFMREFTTPSFPIYMFDKDGEYKIATIAELLPDSFGPDDLS
ncbi:hypothetical protein UA08_06283 [Talaromyces atroroseus]|uniref:Cytidine deaminase n=1 Tax=Talaromyces atroroseus TaxID=1441469 RepID=A0A225AHG8_TALAT|nr:hypothetical protein UA08_06283 [Talaromyces atroroseus]OKL58693.1 hypothetical protein UA08_06283 [Talaromyces atroroseus]